MRRRARLGLLSMLLCCGASASSLAQAPPADNAPAPAGAVPAPQQPVPAQTQVPDNPSPAVTGGKLHGTVKSGNIPLPGVTVTAQNTLTGKRFTTTTDITGAWSMEIPQNGRYVIRTQFAAFAQGSGEAVLNATSHEQAVNFDLMLSSRAAAQAQQQEGQEN